jgi:hypothetical protein
MDPKEVRAIRGSLSRAAFAKLLGVTSLAVLRWELADGSKEARRPRPKMIESLRKLAPDGSAHAAAASVALDPSRALGCEGWSHAEDARDRAHLGGSLHGPSSSPWHACSWVACAPRALSRPSSARMPSLRSRLTRGRGTCVNCGTWSSAPWRTRASRSAWAPSPCASPCADGSIRIGRQGRRGDVGLERAAQLLQQVGIRQCHAARALPRPGQLGKGTQQRRAHGFGQ